MTTLRSTARTCSGSTGSARAWPYAPDPGARFGAGAMAVRDGFGEVAAIVGLRAELRF